MPAAGLVLPVATYSFLKKMKWLPKNTLGLAAVRLLLIYSSFSLLALPMSTAIFKPQQTVKIDEIEHEDLNLVESGYMNKRFSETGKIMYFYKGC